MCVDMHLCGHRVSLHMHHFLCVSVLILRRILLVNCLRVTGMAWHTSLCACYELLPWHALLACALHSGMVCFSLVSPYSRRSLVSTSPSSFCAACKGTGAHAHKHTHRCACVTCLQRLSRVPTNTVAACVGRLRCTRQRRKTEVLTHRGTPTHAHTKRMGESEMRG